MEIVARGARDEKNWYRGGELQVWEGAEGAPGAAHHGWAAPGEKFKFGVPKRDF